MKISKYILVILPLIALISCSSPSDVSSSPSTSQTGLEESSSHHQNADLETRYTSTKSSYQLIADKGREISSLPSIGDVNILVIPIQFSDYPASSLKEGYEGSLSRIEDAFFRESDDNSDVESVASFYEKSSYGKLHIHGTVMDWYTAPYTYSQYSRISNTSQQIKYVENILAAAVNSYEDAYDLTVFDTDKDDCIDAVWLVYSAPMSTSGNDMFWAFTTWASLSGTTDGLNISDYSWASYHFLDEGGYLDYPDAHTFIHETGHLLGLDDYYNYDSTSASLSYPAGSLDMMDYNIGDHMALSKYNLGWISPTVVTESQTLSIAAFENNGEALLVAAPNYNNSPFWEYYLIQYYTPTGLNKLDATNNYKEQYPLMYSESGLLVYRVNQKLGEMMTTNSVFGQTSYWSGAYIEDLNSLDNLTGSYDVINANSPSRSNNIIASSTKLVELVSAAKNYTQSRQADNRDIFVESTTFTAGYNRWEDGTRMDFSFTVQTLTETTATINFVFA